MKRFAKFGGAILFVVFSVGLFGLGGNAATAATISTWNVGSGQPKDNFLFVADDTFPAGRLELGMRAIHRQSPIPVPVVGNTYYVHPGHQTAGEFGAPVTHIGRNRWNFDYHIGYWSQVGDDGITYSGDGGVTRPDLLLTMLITSPAGNTVSLPIFDMKLMANDNVTGSQPFPMGDSQDPTYFIQDSQNPVFAPWFVPTFDMNVTGTYSFTLTAIEGDNELSLTMYVEVVPAPGAMVMLGMGGLVAFRRRR